MTSLPTRISNGANLLLMLTVLPHHQSLYETLRISERDGTTHTGPTQRLSWSR
jgi:hypothetical protein